MKEIKVTVSYEQPNTSKFDALMAEYEAAKKYADATEAYYKPLADAAEEAKFDAIMEQLQTIKGYAMHISNITGKDVFIQVWIGAYRLDANYHHNNGHFNVSYGGLLFTKTSVTHTRNPFFEGTNLIGRWDELHAYQELEAEAFELMRTAINKQKKRAEYQINRLNNITKGGN